MSDTPPIEPKPPGPRRRLQFGLGSMLLAVLPISILSAAWAGMMGVGASQPLLPQGFFVIMAAAAPLALVLFISLGRSALRRRRQGRRRE
jgi:hypothetical protein